MIFGFITTGKVVKEGPHREVLTSSRFGQFLLRVCRLVATWHLKEKQVSDMNRYTGGTDQCNYDIEKPFFAPPIGRSTALR